MQEIGFGSLFWKKVLAKIRALPDDSEKDISIRQVLAEKPSLEVDFDKEIFRKLLLMSAVEETNTTKFIETLIKNEFEIRRMKDGNYNAVMDLWPKSREALEYACRN